MIYVEPVYMHVDRHVYIYICTHTHMLTYILCVYVYVYVYMYEADVICEGLLEMLPTSAQDVALPGQSYPVPLAAKSNQTLPWTSR